MAQLLLRQVVDKRRSTPKTLNGLAIVPICGIIVAEYLLLERGFNVTKRILAALVTAIIILTFTGAVFAETDNASQSSVIVANAGFETLDDNGLPALWEFGSYLYDNGVSNADASAAAEVDVSGGGYVLHISSTAEDDVRFAQTITVEPNSTYKISCRIKTSNVEGGAGANIGMIGGFIACSTAITGTNDWQNAELIGVTDSDQTTICIACRLGGYSALSRGDVWYDDIKVEKLTDYSGQTVNFFVSSSIADSGSDNSSNGLRIIGIIILCLLGLAVLIFAIWSICNKNGAGAGNNKRQDKSGTKYPSVSKEERVRTDALNEIRGTDFFDMRQNSIPRPTDTKLHFKRLDWIFMIGLTVVYGVVALLNLGTTASPESYWSAVKGDSIRIEFDGEYTVSDVWQNSGICKSCTYTITGDSGTSLSQSIEYGQMYRWTKLGGLSQSTTGVTVTVQNGTAWINELAFFDSDGNQISCHTSDGSASPLIDEQDTVPAYPSYFNGMYFDELYHGRTAYEHLNNLEVYEWTHPPLGKLLISVGIAIFGMNPFGWRIIGTLFGIAMIPVMYCFSKRLFKRPELAFLASFLFAFDFMHFTQTRIATIDVYGVFFILLMTYFMYKFLCIDIGDSTKKMLAPLALSGIFFGLGSASKWICLYTGVGLAVMFFTKLIVMGVKSYKLTKASKAASDENLIGKFWKRCTVLCAWCLLFFVAIPSVIYCASYFRYYTSMWKPDAQKQELVDRYQRGEYTTEEDGIVSYEDVELTLSQEIKTYLTEVWNNQTSMYSYHSGLDSVHSAASVWWEWLLNLRPTWFYVGYNAPGENIVSTISTFGNPMVWLVCLAGTIALIVLLIIRKKRFSWDSFMIFVCIASSLLPWVFVTRSTYAYHYFATVPFIILASVSVLKYIEDKHAFNVKFDKTTSGLLIPSIKWIWIGLAALMFIVFYPVISGYPVPRDYVLGLQWVPFFKFESGERTIRIGWTFLGYGD